VQFESEDDVFVEAVSFFRTAESLALQLGRILVNTSNAWFQAAKPSLSMLDSACESCPENAEMKE